MKELQCLSNCSSRKHASSADCITFSFVLKVRQLFGLYIYIKYAQRRIIYEAPLIFPMSHIFGGELFLILTKATVQTGQERWHKISLIFGFPWAEIA